MNEISGSQGLHSSSLSPSLSATLTPAASPHAHSKASVPQVMRQVMYALLPATLYGFWLFGWPAINLFFITVTTSLLAEWLCQRMMGRAITLNDGSALLTAWLLALSLPPWAPGWVGVLGGLIAIVIAKQVFGGLGQNLFNPAMVARAALLVSFPVVMTQWVAPQPLFSASAPSFVDSLSITFGTTFGFNTIPDAIASASLLGFTKTELARGVSLSALFTDTNQWHLISGMHAGSLGENSAWLILAGGLYLIATGLIGWQIPAAVLLGIALPALLAHSIDPERYLSASQHLLSGAAMLGAFFIATDYVTSPNTAKGQLVFGLGIGVLTWTIRTLGGYPEGMAFAVLLMNALTPVIDRYLRPRIHGRKSNGEPITLKAIHHD